MALTPLSAPSRALKVPSTATLAVLSSALRDLRLTPTSLPHRRNASHQAQGRANGAKDGPGKRLGAKKSGGEYVIPGNILFKQRGTHWFPGDHCFMGRDHTIHAGAPGYVRYYRDPMRHPKRKFIGLVFEKTQSLPQPPHAVRRRTLGMLAYQQKEVPPTPTSTLPEQSSRLRVVKRKGEQDLHLALRPGYQYRQANYEIGRAAEIKEAELQKRGATTRMYPKFKPGDRFAAWRKRTERVARNAERRAARLQGKKSKK